jgi:tetratricopeptide (TPR) repeat protein
MKQNIRKTLLLIALFIGSISASISQQIDAIIKKGDNLTLVQVDSLLKLYPDSVEFNYFKTRKYIEAQDQRRVLQMVRKMETDYPNHVLTHVLLGFIYELDENYSKSITEISLAIRQYPDDYLLYHDRGLVYSKMKNVADALTDLKKSLTLNPNHISTYDNIANIYKDDGQTLPALKQYHEVLEREPEYARTLNNLGVQHVKHGNFKIAIDYYARCAKAKPDYTKVYTNRAALHTKMGANGLACQDMYTLYQLANGMDSLQYYTLCHVHDVKKLKGDLAEVYQTYHNMVDSKYASINSHLTMLEFLTTYTIDYKAIVHYAHKTLEKDSTYFAVHMYLAETYKKKKDIDSSIYHYEQTLKKGEGNIQFKHGAYCSYTLSKLYREEKNNLTKAEARLNAAYKIDDIRNYEPAIEFAEILIAKKKYEAALPYLNKAIKIAPISYQAIELRSKVHRELKNKQALKEDLDLLKLIDRFEVMN